MQFRELLHHLVEKEASDLYLSTGAAPSVKVNGELIALEQMPITPNMVKSMAYQIMTDEQIQEFEQKKEMNLAISEPKIGRFRVNIFIQRNQVSLVVRHIKTEIPDLESLGAPAVLKEVMLEKRGLFLLVGATGTGKSTTLASLIDYRNQNSCGHIITIEDPIEYIHNHKKCIVNQREVGIDTESYQTALTNTLRQSPDVILIGEVRAQETMQHAISFSETGHLCLSTMHASNANQALDRIINFFAEEKRDQLLLDLSLNVRAIVSQRLIPDLNGGRVAAFEILLGTPLVSDLIRRGEFHTLKEIMAKSENVGMQTFDMALFNLYRDGAISYKEALANADSKNNLRLKISLNKNNVSDDELTIEEFSSENPMFLKSIDKIRQKSPQKKV